MTTSAPVISTRFFDHGASGITRRRSWVVLVLLFALSHFSPSASRAETAENPESASASIPFSGIVQHAKGRSEKIETKTTRSSLGFRSLLHEGDRVRVAASSTLKIVTREGCTAVVYGPAQITTPIGKKPWRIQGAAVRWICPENRSDNFVHNQSRFQVHSGDVLVDGAKALALNGRITVFNPEPLPLETMKLYRNQKKSWALDSPQPHAYELWLLNESRTAPKESRDLAKPDGPPGSRLIFSPMSGAGLSTYDVGYLDETSLELNGARIQLQRPWQTSRGQGSLIASFMARGMRDLAKQGEPDKPSPIGTATDSDLFALELGYRFDHARWWSPVVRAGLGVQHIQVQINRSDIGFFDRTEYKFYCVMASAGLEAQYSPRFISWLGLYAGAELQVIQSLVRDGAVNKLDHGNYGTGNDTPPEAREPWRLTNISGQFMLGLFLQF
jgi:hypothetical protein